MGLTNAERQARHRTKRRKQQAALEAELRVLRNAGRRAKASADTAQWQAEIKRLKTQRDIALTALRDAARSLDRERQPGLFRRIATALRKIEGTQRTDDTIGVQGISPQTDHGKRLAPDTKAYLRQQEMRQALRDAERELNRQRWRIPIGAPLGEVDRQYREALAATRAEVRATLRKRWAEKDSRQPADLPPHISRHR